MKVVPKIVVHGGAGNIRLRSDRAEPFKRVLIMALEEGLKALDQSANAERAGMDAVVTAVSILEDSPLFNAGVGSVLNEKGRVEMDAALMLGNGAAGGVAMLSKIKNPIVAAQKILDEGRHVFLAGAEAETFAIKSGCATIAPKKLITNQRHQDWLRLKNSTKVELDHGNPGSHGTVGAVAVDSRGRVFAATSTGGMTNKRAGRISDSAQIGAGTYADNRTCAVSATGTGEYFIKACAAFDVHARMLYSELDLGHALEQSLSRVAALGGSGGFIGVDTYGNHAFQFNTTGMFRGVLDKSGQILVGV